MYENQTVGSGMVERPPVRWTDRTEEYFKKGDGRGFVNDIKSVQNVKRMVLLRNYWRGQGIRVIHKLINK